MKVDTLIRMALAGTGEQSQASQSLNPEKENNSQLSTLNSQLTEKAAVQMDAERLKFIDELSRLILELKKQFPEIAQNLLKTRDNVPANLENIPVKDLINLLKTVQQNLSVLTDTATTSVEKTEIAEKIKNLVGEIIKILQPSSESPPEQKLIQALSKNDFASANIAIRNIVEASIAQIPKIPQNMQTAQIPQPVQMQIPQTMQTTQQNIQTPQNTQNMQTPQPVPVQMQIPQAAQQTMQQPVQIVQIPQPVQTTQQIPQTTQAPQPVQIQIPQAAQQTMQQPMQTTQQNTQIAQPMQTTQPVQPVQMQIPQPVQTTQQNTQIAQPMQTMLPVLPAQTPQPVQNTQNIQQSFQIIYNALQELKELGIPKELQNAPLKELEIIALQKIGIDVPEIKKDLAKNLSAVFNEKPVFAAAVAVATPTPQPEQSVQIRNHVPIRNHAPIQDSGQTRDFGQTHRSAPTSVNTHIQIHTPINTNTNTNTNVNVNANTVFEIPLPKNFPLKIPPNHKIEMAFSLYQIPNQIPNQNQHQNQTGETKFILQPWPASTQIPKEERNFWIKTDLPFTPQILNLREAILSFGKLPENPETVRLFASGMHELSLLTEHGASVSKEHANLLLRVAQTVAGEGTVATVVKDGLGAAKGQEPAASGNQIQLVQSEKHLPLQITQTLLKYQPLGNYEGDLFKNLPEPARRELLNELPAGKTWQPETLQKAVEKVLEKYIEPPQTANSNEHTIKAHEEIKNTLQNLKEQIQWTRIDQDTRLQNDKENVFYFMHDGELQKGRLKVKDERKGGSKKHQNSSISFSIETKAKNLGKVHADLTLSKNILNIRLQDEIGTAGDAVKEERETLAKELADIGISLGELLYGKTPRVQNLPIAKKEDKSSSGLDVRA